MEQEKLTVDDVAQIIRFKPDAVRAAIRRGELSASRIFGQWRIDPTDLADWVSSCRVQPQASSTSSMPAAAPRPRRRPPAGGARQAVRDRRSAA